MNKSMGLATEHRPTPARASRCDGGVELHLTEPAVMLAMAHWLIGHGATDVEIHPDGMHLKQLDMGEWLSAQGFEKTAQIGATEAGGRYENGGTTVTIDPRPGIGDVVAMIDGKRIEIEAKCGCINSRHPGPLSKLRKHLYEAVGMLLDSRNDADRLIAAVPHHSETERVAKRMAKRCHAAGIEIALVSGDGSVWMVE
jgi:hypothetical protein